MGGDVLLVKRRTDGRRLGDVHREAVLDGVAAERASGEGREEWVGWRAAAFGEPGSENLHGPWQQGCSTFLATLCRGQNYVALR